MDLIINPISLNSIDHTELLKKMIAYEKASLSINTSRTYAVMWKKFEKWCQIQNLNALPTSSDTISLFLTSLAGTVSFSTLDLVIAAIEKTHEQHNALIQGDSAFYRRVRKGVRRMHKEVQTLKQAKALSMKDLSSFCRQLSKKNIDIRDKAMITTAFFGALRRSEIVMLDMRHIEFNERGMILSLLQTKTSDEVIRVYIGKTLDESICPVIAMSEWIEKSQIHTGPLFKSLFKGDKISNKRLSAHAVAVIMKKRFGENYSGHSLRRGVITALAQKGVPTHKIQYYSRHKTADMVLRYIENIEGFENCAISLLQIMI